MNVSKLLTEHNQYIWKLVHKYNKCGASIEELYQEAVVGFLEGIEKYDSDRCPKLMYYCSFYIKDRIFKYFNSMQDLNPLDEVIDASNPEKIVSKLELLEKAENNYKLLNLKEKTIIEKVFLEGMKQYEVAKLLSISPERVRQLKVRALKKLCIT
jgi:RNA polymerase sigma factor (sigma-70 family)